MAGEHDVPDMPSWIIQERLDFFIGTELETGYAGTEQMVEEARAVIPPLARLERELVGEQRVASSSQQAPLETSQTYHGKVHLVCLARLLLGACCEAFACIQSSKIAKPGFRPHGVAASRKLARLYSDACHAATWTSAHAQYIHDLLTLGMVLHGPSIHSIPCEASELDMSELYAHRFSNRPLPSADAEKMLSVLTRCTNPGSRGWDGSLKSTLENSNGSKRVLSNALSVALTGMNSCIHPSSRLQWRQRMALILHVERANPFTCIASFCEQPVAFKECTRRYLSNATSSSMASNAAFTHLEHPMAFLASCPVSLPPDGLQCSATAFAKAGKMILESRGATGIVASVASAFRSMAVNLDEAQDTKNSPLAWNPGYLGKGTASIHHKVPATSVAANIWSMAFRCNFIPFWTHSATQNLRAARLDTAQYNAVHGLNAATNLTLLLSDEERMFIQRCALQKPSSGLMTLEEVAKTLGINNVRGSSCNGGAKGAMDAVKTIGEAGSKGAAVMLQFCRIASISESVLIYDLGEKTRALQTTAVVKRALADEFYGDDGAVRAADLLGFVPKHTRELCACIECKRVANAICTDGGMKWKTCFNEIGSSGSMASTDCDTMEMSLKCAKRSSASLKTAVAFEEEMSNRAIENVECSASALTAMISSDASSSNGVASRVRRDAKSALEQRRCSVACGQESMLSIPILGHAVRLWGEWYALCSYCGCFIRFHPSNKFDSELCCLRCDYDMLNRRNKSAALASTLASDAAPACRYCGKVDPLRSGARWRAVKAPLDTSGANAVLPPPLRIVHFCPQHFRTWIPSCMKTMATRVILSHIVYGARPCYQATPEAEEEEQDAANAAKSNKKRKRRVPSAAGK